jgi:hypothetical protein
MRHRSVMDEDKDLRLSEERASEDIDHQEPDSIRVPEWLVGIEDAVVAVGEDTIGEDGGCVVAC